MNQLIISIIIFVITVILFFSGKFSLGLIGLCAAVALQLTGVLDAATVWNNFTNESVVMFVSLFVLSAGLMKTRLISNFVEKLAKLQGNERKVLWGCLIITMLLAVFMNATAAVATMLPMRHTNHRILAYLRSAYPQATFEWCEKQPEQLIRNGGTGRIRVFGIDEFDHADVTLDQNANIKCDMVKIVPLSKVGGELSENDTTPPNRQPADPRIWYETQGRSVLEALISDLNSRGHSKLTLREDGDICIEQGEDAVSQEHLNNFPQKVYWPRLAEVLESNGLAAEVTAQGIQVSW